MKREYIVKERQFAGDLHTPVSIYLKVRDIYPQSALLESSDYHSSESSRSCIALCPIGGISINNYKATITLPEQEQIEKTINESYSVSDAIEEFMNHFSFDAPYGLWGYTAYDAVKYFENIAIKTKSPEDNDAPDIHYILYRYTLVFDHFHNTLTLKELLKEGEQSSSYNIIAAIEKRNFSQYEFHCEGETFSTINDDQYMDMVRRAKEHSFRGNTFQMVLSRRFIQRFRGDDFEVYRSLRRINPSPYLFYFDFGGVRIFGSSPETHCKIENGRAIIDPIAGTAFRTGNTQDDIQLAKILIDDPKENAEHVMLVDLARNDLSRNATDVKVDLYKEIQYFSHVIHLVSRVGGTLSNESSAVKCFVDTFPAGTLSGAPKVKAMELINEIEPHNRGIYGGAIGYIGFDGSLNHAITIRTFVSRNSTLEFQAGAGIVALSDPQRELQEVNNKLGALSKAILSTTQNNRR